MKETKIYGWSTRFFNVFQFHFRGLSEEDEKIEVVQDFGVREIIDFKIITNNVSFWESVCDRLIANQIKSK